MLRYLLVVDGVLPEKPFIQHLHYDKVVATDGSAIKLKAMGIEPHVIIGDLDSLQKHTQSKNLNELIRHFPNSEIIQNSNQDTTDFDKSMDYFLKIKTNMVEIIGLFGGDIDHTFYNLFRFAEYARKIPLRFYNDQQIGWLIESSAKFKAPMGAKVSLLPIESSKLSTKGLKWDLSDSILSPTAAISARNEVEADCVHIQIKSGRILCVVQLKDMLWPVLISEHN